MESGGSGGGDSTEVFSEQPHMVPTAPFYRLLFYTFFKKSPSWVVKGLKEEENKKTQREEGGKRECGAEIAVLEHPIVIALH